jgi:hypothetical protein
VTLIYVRGAHQKSMFPSACPRQSVSIVDQQVVGVALPEVKLPSRRSAGGVMSRRPGSIKRQSRRAVLGFIEVPRGACVELGHVLGRLGNI